MVMIINYKKLSQNTNNFNRISYYVKNKNNELIKLKFLKKINSLTS